MMNCPICGAETSSLLCKRCESKNDKLGTWYSTFKSGVFAKEIRISLYLNKYTIQGDGFISILKSYSDSDDPNVLTIDNAREKSLIQDATHMDCEPFEFCLVYVNNVVATTFKGQPAIQVDLCRKVEHFVEDVTVYIPSILDTEEVVAQIQNAVNETKERSSDKMEQYRLEKSKKDAEFFLAQYNTYIEQYNYPSFNVSLEDNCLYGLYVDDEQGLNFIAINGIHRTVQRAFIPVENINYYKKISYTAKSISEKDGFFGGSFVASQFHIQEALDNYVLLYHVEDLPINVPVLPDVEHTFSPINTDNYINTGNIVLNYYNTKLRVDMELELPLEALQYLQSVLPEFDLTKKDEEYDTRQAIANADQEDALAILNAKKEQAFKETQEALRQAQEAKAAALREAEEAKAAAEEAKAAALLEAQQAREELERLKAAALHEAEETKHAALQEAEEAKAAALREAALVALNQKALEEEQLRIQQEAEAKKAEEERIRLEQEEAARKAEEERIRLEQEEAARKAEEERIRLEQEEAARKAEEERIRLEQEEKARKAEEERIRKEQEEARKAEEARIRKEQEEIARKKREEEFKQRKAEQITRYEASMTELELQLQEEIKLREQKKIEEEQLRKEEAERIRLEQEEKARKEAELQAQAEAQEAKRQEEEQRKIQEAEEQARKAAEELARKEAEEMAKLQAELKAKKEAEDLAKKLEEERVRQELEEQARKEEEEIARALAEEQARKEAEKAKLQAQLQAEEAAKEQALKEAEEQARLEAEEQALREAATSSTTTEEEEFNSFDAATAAAEAALASAQAEREALIAEANEGATQTLKKSKLSLKTESETVSDEPAKVPAEILDETKDEKKGSSLTLANDDNYLSYSDSIEDTYVPGDGITGTTDFGDGESLLGTNSDEPENPEEETQELDEFEAKIMKLKLMMEHGLISETEFNEAKKQLLTEL